MKEIVLKICVTAVVFEVIKVITPSGNLSKFTDTVYSIILVIMIFNVVAGFDFVPSFDLSVPNETEYEETFEEDVYEEYKKKVESIIEEKTGANAEVVFEGYNIESVAFDKDPGIFAINYLVSELGVDRNDIIVGKNQ
jgi:hypothetical protein